MWIMAAESILTVAVLPVLRTRMKDAGLILTDAPAARESEGLNGW
jgi:hypothetical protein